MKKLTAIILTLAVLAAIAVPASAADELTAYPSTQTFYLDGEQVELAAYKINGNNYVKLRDLYKLLDYKVAYGTLSTGQFILYTWTDKSYKPDGSESTAMPTENATAYTSTIYGRVNQTMTDPEYEPEATKWLLDRTPKIAAYKIAGSNYIQLRNYAETLYSAATADYSETTPGYGQGYNLNKPDSAIKTFDVRYNPVDKSVQILTDKAFTGKDIGDNSPVATPNPTPTPTPVPTPAPYKVYTSVPKVGEQVTTFERTGNAGNNYIYINAGRSIGIDCMWYAFNRFEEIHSFTPGWEYKEKPDDSWKTVTTLNSCPALSIAVYYRNGAFAHVLFIEYVERDNKGNPTKVYYTESSDALVKAGIEPGTVKVKTWTEFQKTNAGADLNCYIVKK